ncbi:4878_t:CDS:1 [Paraglomus occultum]|uniref:4878_t:CDS:1 n=1 Tax=Paraglomus occultum TaxID=144539 RepID=A0A9N9B1R5_9GLOM|nr:4878_t:CDS:1 [Paraglomus occultum]
MFSSSQRSTNSALQQSTWNGNDSMVTSVPVDSSVSQILDSPAAFLYTNTDSSSEPTQTLNTTVRSPLVPIKPLISPQKATTELRIRPQTTGERSNASQDKVLTIEELRSIENLHSVNATVDAPLDASNDSIRPSLNTALPSPAAPVQAVTPPPSRPRSGRKRKAESPEEKEARVKDRVLRNRAAAQLSRNKKRQQLVDLEEQNTILRKELAAQREENAACREENERMSKRMRMLEAKLEDIETEFEKFRSQQLQSRQNVLPSPEIMVSHPPLDDVRGSAVSVVTLENSSLVSGNGKKAIVNVRTHSNKSLPGRSYRFEPSMHECSKSLQRIVKLRSLYQTFSQQISYRQMLKPILMILLVFLTTLNVGQKNYYYQCLDKIKRMEFADNVVISELMRRLQKRRLRSVRGKLSRGAKSGEYEWSKYPP